MSPHEEEIRNQATQTPFVAFTLVTSSGERIRVLTGDHIEFSPNTDETGEPLPEEERSQSFIVWARGAQHRIIFFDAINHLEVGLPA